MMFSLLTVLTHLSDSASMLSQSDMYHRWENDTVCDAVRQFSSFYFLMCCMIYKRLCSWVDQQGGLWNLISVYEARQIVFACVCAAPNAQKQVTAVWKQYSCCHEWRRSVWYTMWGWGMYVGYEISTQLLPMYRLVLTKLKFVIHNNCC